GGSGATQQKGDDAPRADRRELARDVEGMKRLQEFSGLLVDDEPSDGLFEHILDAAIAIMHSDFASIQELDPERGALNLVAWKNFHPEAAEIWRVVSTEDASVCGSALRLGERVIVRDVREVEALQGTESLRAFMLSNIRAVQSTPLATRSGRLLGMLS